MSRKKQKTRPEPERIEVSVEEISAIVERTQAGALSAEDHAKLKAAIDTFTLITAQLQTKDASIERLRQMIFGATTECTRNVLGERRGEPPAAGGLDGRGARLTTEAARSWAQWCRRVHRREPSDGEAPRSAQWGGLSRLHERKTVSAERAGEVGAHHRHGAALGDCLYLR